MAETPKEGRERERKHKATMLLAVAYAMLVGGCYWQLGAAPALIIGGLTLGVAGWFQYMDL